MEILLTGTVAFVLGSSVAFFWLNYRLQKSAKKNQPTPTTAAFDFDAYTELMRQYAVLQKETHQLREDQLTMERDLFNLQLEHERLLSAHQRDMREYAEMINSFKGRLEVYTEEYGILQKKLKYYQDTCNCPDDFNIENIKN